MYLRRLVSPHIWKRACTTVAAAPMAAKAKAKAPDPAGIETSAAPVASAQRGKRKILQKLRYLTVETVDLILREEEKKGISVTQEDLLRWAKSLGKKEAKYENALAILEWMDKKKMIFSPSDLAYYVLVIDKVKGFDAANEYFEKVDPKFDNMDHKSKNWPAYTVLYNLAEEDYENNPRRQRL